MKSYKDMLNKSYKDLNAKPLSKTDSLAMKRCLLDIYKAISAVCDDYNLQLILTGGSCLGAIRHNGFIPWDDDLDMIMPRPDYEKLIYLLEEGVLGEKFEFTYPNSYKDSPAMFLKIYRKGTTLISIDGESDVFPNGIFVDIFPLDGIPSNSIKRWCKGIIANTLRIIANMTLESGKISSYKKSLCKDNLNLRIIIWIRHILGIIFSVINHRYWVYWYDSFVKENDMSGLVGIPTGRYLYNGETFPSNVYLPPSKGCFEGLEVSLPAEWHLCMKNLYSNYMQIPPIEKRESHFVSSIKIPQEFYEN